MLEGWFCGCAVECHGWLSLLLCGVVWDCQIYGAVVKSLTRGGWGEDGHGKEVHLA